MENRRTFAPEALPAIVPQFWLFTRAGLHSALLRVEKGLGGVGMAPKPSLRNPISRWLPSGSSSADRQQSAAEDSKRNMISIEIMHL